MGLWTGTIVSAFVATFAPRWVDSWRQSEHSAWPPFVPNDPVLPMPVPSVPHVRIDVKPNVRDMSPFSTVRTDDEDDAEPAVPKYERMAPPDVPMRPTKLAAEKAVQVFIKYMQDGKAAGVYAYEEIDEFWRMACDQLHLVELTGETIREQLETLGHFIGRKQLARDFPEVRLRTGRSRATLYRIPTKAQSAARPPKQKLVIPSSNQPLPGQGLGTDENPSENRRVAA